MSGTEGSPGFADPAQKGRVVLEAVLEPIILILEADQNACGFAVARDDDLAANRQAEISRQVVLHLGEGDFTPGRAPRATPGLLPWR